MSLVLGGGEVDVACGLTSGRRDEEVSRRQDRKAALPVIDEFQGHDANSCVREM